MPLTDLEAPDRNMATAWRLPIYGVRQSGAQRPARFDCCGSLSGAGRTAPTLERTATYRQGGGTRSRVPSADSRAGLCAACGDPRRHRIGLELGLLVRRMIR